MQNTVLGDLRTSDVETEFAKFRARFEDFNRINELGTEDDPGKVKETFNLLIKGLRNVNDPCHPYVFSPLLAKPYSSDRTYSKGDWTISENAYWICTEAITVPEKWNAAHWERHDDLIAYLLSQGGGGAGAVAQELHDMRREVSEIDVERPGSIRKLKDVVSDMITAISPKDQD